MDATHTNNRTTNGLVTVEYTFAGESFPRYLSDPQFYRSEVFTKSKKLAAPMSPDQAESAASRAIAQGIPAVVVPVCYKGF